MRATLRWASGRSPRNVTFQSARPPDKATGRRDKVLELLLFKNRRTKSSRNFQKQLLQLFLIKSTNRRNYWDACHVEMGIRSKSSKCRFSIGSAAGQTDGPTGQGPRTVNFSKNLRTSRNFQQLQLFSIKSTTRWNYWDEWHVEMVIRPGSLNFHFSTGSAAGLRDDVCLLYTDYIACFCEIIFVRDNVFTMFPWLKWILHMKLSTKVNFLVWKSARFATKISVY